MKRKIYTIGETVYDIIFKDGELQTGKPGGSMLNASVSLGRAGLNVYFVTEIGDDDLGKNILHFLNQNNINTSFIHSFEDGKTPLALAFLDESSNASYSFYKSYPQKRLQQKLPEIHKNDILLFGSFFAINPEIREIVLDFVRKAKSAGAIIIYDPNIRHPKAHELEEVRNAVLENCALADIVRGSNEDFKLLFGVDTPSAAANILKQNSNALLIYTHSSRFVYATSRTKALTFEVPKIAVVSTIGAGDNFNAGLIYALVKNTILKDDLQSLDESDLGNIILSGISFSQEVCKSFENYIPVDFANGIKKPKE